MTEAVAVRSLFVDPSESPAAEHAQIFAYWNAKRGDRLAPAWREISLMDMPASRLPLISVTDITPEPLHSTYRYWGSDLTKVFGRDYTGYSPSDVPPRSLGVSADGGCGRLARQRRPHLEIKEFTSQKGLYGRALVLRLPLSDDGVNVNHGINAYEFEPFGGQAELTQFFDDVFSKLDETV